MFHYPQVPPFDHQAVHLPYLPRLRSWKPSVKFCPAFARGFCQAEEQCTLYHISLKEIHCKFDQKGTCKFGSDCYFKHSPKRQKEQSDLTPIIQHIARENLELVQRVEKAELRIGALENELAELKALHEASHSKPAKPSPKPNKAGKITKTTPSQMASANTRGKFPVTIPPNSALRTPTSQKIQTAKLPWIPANKSRVKTPNSKKPPYFEFEDIQLVIPTKEVIEHRHTRSVQHWL